MLNLQDSPEEIKSREVELGLRAGLLSLQLFPNGGATDIVFVTLLCTAVGTAIAWYASCCAMPDGRCLNILLFWRRSTAAFVFRVGACCEVSLFCPPFPLVSVPNRPPRLRGREAKLFDSIQGSSRKRRRVASPNSNSQPPPIPLLSVPNESYGFCGQCMLCFALINSLLLNLLCVWI